VNSYFSGAGIPIHIKADGSLAIDGDEFVEGAVEAPFWDALEGNQWANVRSDLREAYSCCRAVVLVTLLLWLLAASRAHSR